MKTPTSFSAACKISAFLCWLCPYAWATANLACTPRPVAPELVRQESLAMGTTVQLTAYASPGLVTSRAMAEAFAELHRVEVLMTTWEHPGWPRSDIMRLNDAAGQGPVRVSADTFTVLAAAQAMAAISEGRFDVTFGAMGGLWKFDEDLETRVPPPAMVRARLALVNYRDLHLDAANQQAQLMRPGMRVNLGGIAKGYGVDACARILRAHGLQNFLVQAGGDLYVAGTKGGAPWKVGIRDPRAANDAYFAMASLQDHAFSTAGDYERAFVLNGRRYHHILDPATGEPATASRSVTVFAPTALLADALDDTLFILGAQKGLALLKEHHPDCGAVIVDAQNQVWISDILRDRVVQLHPPTEGL